MSQRFDEAVVLVAGGTGGLGRAVVLAFLRAGAQVVTTYRGAAKLDALRAELGASAAHLDGCSVDLSDAAAARQSIEAAVTRHGHLDILVNTVGGYTGGQNVWQTDTSVLEQLLSLNVRVLHTLLQAVMPLLLTRNRGCIVNIAAKAAIIPPRHAAVYAASKAAALAMMTSLTAELAGTGVRANSILPGTIDTEANQAAMPKADFASWVAPEQIAELILFLCSGAGAAVRGAQIVL